MDDGLMERIARAIIKEGANDPDFYAKISKALKGEDNKLDFTPAPKTADNKPEISPAPKAAAKSGKKIKKIIPKKKRT